MGEAALRLRLEYLFGMGQGRHVDHCVAKYLGIKHRERKSVAGHRKLGYLVGVPDRLLEKFSNFYLALALGPGAK